METSMARLDEAEIDTRLAALDGWERFELAAKIDSAA
jgi:hypothetical protein